MAKLLGAETTTTHEERAGKNRIFAFKVATGSLADTVEEILAVMGTKTEAGQKYHLGIYEDSAGNPGKLMAEKEVTKAGAGEGTITATGFNVKLQPSTTYWLAVNIQNATTEGTRPITEPEGHEETIWRSNTGHEGALPEGGTVTWEFHNKWGPMRLWANGKEETPKGEPNKPNDQYGFPTFLVTALQLTGVNCTSFTVVGLPEGLTATEGGEITGTPKKVQTATVKVTGVNSSKEAGTTIEFKWTIEALHPYNQAVMESKPVGYLRCDSTTAFHDVIHGYLATATGSPTLVEGALEPNDSNKATHFPGSAFMSFASTASAFELNSEFSVECWIKTTVGGGVVVEKCIGSTPGTQWALTTSERIEAVVWQSSTQYGGAAGAAHPCNTTQADLQAPTIGPWIHVAMTYDKTYLRLYKNGHQYDIVKVGSGGAVIDHGAGVLTIAAQGSGASSYEGSVDEVSLYNKVLTAAEIKAHHDALVELREDEYSEVINKTAAELGKRSLRTYYRCNDTNSGGVIADYSGEGNHGHLVAAGSWPAGSFLSAKGTLVNASKILTVTAEESNLAELRYIHGTAIPANTFLAKKIKVGEWELSQAATATVSTPETLTVVVTQGGQIGPVPGNETAPAGIGEAILTPATKLIKDSTSGSIFINGNASESGAQGAGGIDIPLMLPLESGKEWSVEFWWELHEEIGPSPASATGGQQIISVAEEGVGSMGYGFLMTSPDNGPVKEWCKMILVPLNNSNAFGTHVQFKNRIFTGPGEAIHLCVTWKEVAGKAVIKCYVNGKENPIESEGTTPPSIGFGFRELPCNYVAGSRIVKFQSGFELSELTYGASGRVEGDGWTKNAALQNVFGAAATVTGTITNGSKFITNITAGEGSLTVQGLVEGSGIPTATKSVKQVKAKEWEMSEAATETRTGTIEVRPSSVVNVQAIQVSPAAEVTTAGHVSIQRPIAPARIGAMAEGKNTAEGANGHIAEIAFWAAPLTATQVSEHYFAGITSRPGKLRVQATIGVEATVATQQPNALVATTLPVGAAVSTLALNGVVSANSPAQVATSVVNGTVATKTLNSEVGTYV